MRVARWNPKAGDTIIYKNAMERLAKAAEAVANSARQRCPVGIDKKASGKDWTERKAGSLKKSIRVVRLYEDTARNVRVYAGSRKVYYARWVEQGTVKMKAKPFLRPAFHATKPQINAIVQGG